MAQVCNKTGQVVLEIGPFDETTVDDPNLAVSVTVRGGDIGLHKQEFDIPREGITSPFNTTKDPEDCLGRLLRYVKPAGLVCFESAVGQSRPETGL